MLMENIHMAFIELKSDNEKLSWVLQKNPETQRASNAPFIKNSKMYANFLWFENDNTVSLFSKYLNPKNTKQKFDNLDFTQNTKGEVYLQLIDNLLRSALNKDSEFDTQPATLTFSVYNHSGLDYKERMPDIVTKCETKHRHSLIEITAPTVKKALETCCVISLITSFYDEDYYIDDAQYLKYLKFAVELTNEYSLIRQLVSFIKSDKLYASALPFIEKTPFIVGRPRAFDARKNFHRDYMASKTKSRRLLELGAGEGAYFKSHMKHYDQVVSIEPDQEVFTDATHMIRKIKGEEVIQLHNTDAMSHLMTVDTLENTDVLLTEVLEHVDYKHSVEIIDRVLDLKPDSFLITLPNHDFNKFYGYKEGEFRHDDHLWEPTVNEFHEFHDMVSKKCGDSFIVDKHYLGDKVKSQPENCATFAILISKKA